jgi:hypothetical protein
MSSPAMSQGPSSQRTKGSQDSAMGETTGGNEDGVCVRKMRRTYIDISDFGFIATNHSPVYSQGPLYI